VPFGVQALSVKVVSMPSTSGVDGKIFERCG